MVNWDLAFSDRSRSRNFFPSRIRQCRKSLERYRGEDTKRNLKHVGYLFSLVKARRKLLT
jgi:hypothetical protein